MLVSLCLCHISFFWQPLALRIVVCGWGSGCTVIPKSNKELNTRIHNFQPGPSGFHLTTRRRWGTVGTLLSSFQTHFLAVYHCADQDGSCFIVTSPPWSSAAENGGCPQPPSAGPSSRIWEEKRALPPNACCSSGLLPAKKKKKGQRSPTGSNCFGSLCEHLGPIRLSIQPRSGSSGSAEPGERSSPRGSQGWCCSSESASDELQNKTTALQRQIRTTGLGEPNHKAGIAGIINQENSFWFFSAAQGFACCIGGSERDACREIRVPPYNCVRNCFCLQWENAPKWKTGPGVPQN